MFTVFMNRGLRRTMPQREVTALVSKVGRAIALPMRLSLYAAMFTGVINLMNRGTDPLLLLNAEFLQTHFGSLALLKLALSIVVLLAAVYQTQLGGRLSTTQSEPEYATIRRRLLTVGWAALGMTLALTALGTILRYS
ncbi:MAG: hypothetical protein ACE5KH_02515 [Candidatus Geothermarchaeales archaeon]